MTTYGQNPYGQLGYAATAVVADAVLPTSTQARLTRDVTLPEATQGRLTSDATLALASALRIIVDRILEITTHKRFAADSVLPIADHTDVVPILEAPGTLYSPSDYLEVLQGLLPYGAAWSKDPASVFVAFLTAFATAQSTNQATQANLLVDAFPSTSVQLLSAWEASTGLPDACLGPNPTLQERQNSLVARLYGVGGQSLPYFEAVAVLLGYENITFSEYTQYTFGMPFGLPMYGTAWAYALFVNNYQYPAEHFQFGHNFCGDPFAVYGNSALICELRRLMPAHVQLIFAYSG